MKISKTERILEKLIRNYVPFNLLSPERSGEVANVVRFLEMREGDIFQMNPGKAHDFLFVVEGELKIIEDGSVRTGVVPNSTRTQALKLASAPRTSTLIAVQDTTLCLADSDLLDELLAWDEIVHYTEDTDAGLHDALEGVRDALAFRRMPLECVESAFQRMHTVTAKAGEEIVREGEKGDAFYILRSGRAEVWQTGIYDDGPRKVAELQAGDTFGCEALITGKLRCETVRIVEDASIMVLGREDFEDLVSKQLVRSVKPQVARSMIETGHRILDVRYAEEYEYQHIPGAILIPLHELRDRMDELDPDAQYIVYCHSGSRSAVAALKLSQHNLDVVTVEGGIRDWPYETASLEDEAPAQQPASGSAGGRAAQPSRTQAQASAAALS